MKIVSGFIAVTVAIIMIASVLVPVISDALPNVGDPITVSNQNFDSYYKDVDDGDTLVITDTTASFNGNPIDIFSYRGAFYADKAYSYLYGAPSNGIIGFVVDDTGNANKFELVAGRTWTITYGDDSISIVGVADGAAPIEWSKSNFNWILSISDPTNSDYYTIEDLRYADAYVTNAKSQVIYSGYYETGENDTFLSYRNGVITQELDGEYDISVDFDTTLKEGTTDIYKVGVTITVDDEAFVPFLVLVPGVVYGHEDGGSAYAALLAIIPLTIVSILIATVALVMHRNRF